MKPAKWKGGAGVLVLALVFAAAAVNVGINRLRVRSAEAEDGRIRIRICHWHLEAVAGFDRVIKGFQDAYYEKTGKRVTIEQVPVPYTGYAQFVNTSLIGRMAPDIVQLGCSGQLANINTIVRYFVPLGDYVRRPNPYNAESAAAGIPWRDTFVDALRGNMAQELQEYYAIPLSMQTTRMFYNRDLLREITGSGEVPKTYGGFLELCGKVSAFRRKDDGQPVHPIAACNFQEGMFSDTYREAFLQELTQVCDFNFDGVADELETAPHYGKLWTFDAPPFLEASECFRDVAVHFMPGWTAASRDDMMFAFVQQRALMTLTFGYDVKMIRDQVNGAFEIGVAPVPLPTDHPEYGAMAKGPQGEVGVPGGNPLAIVRDSPHLEVCLAFLQYATSPGPNTAFNEATLWLPMVKGASLSDPFLKPFLPQTDGYVSRFKHGGEFDGRNAQFRVLCAGFARAFATGKLTPRAYAEKQKDAYEALRDRGVADMLDERRRMIRGFDRVQAAALYMAFDGPPAERERNLARLPALTASIQKQLFEFHARQAELGRETP